MWAVGAEAFGSFAWVLAATVATLLAVLDIALGRHPATVTDLIAWGIAVAVIASIQLAVALGLQARYDRRSVFTLLLGPIYPLAYWALNAAAAVRSEVAAFVRGPRGERVVWSIAREGDEAAT